MFKNKYIKYKKKYLQLKEQIGGENTMNILILGRSLMQQLKYEDDEGSKITDFINNLLLLNIKIPNNINIYFCDLIGPEVDLIISKDMKSYNLNNNTNFNVKLFAKKVKIASLDHDDNNEFLNKINLKEKVDIIINDMGTIYFFNFNRLCFEINYFLKENGLAFLCGLKEWKYVTDDNYCKNYKFNNKLENYFNINIKINSDMMNLIVNENTKIDEIHCMIWTKLNNYQKYLYGKYQRSLVFAGKRLLIGTKIKDYNIQSDAFLHLVPILRQETTDIKEFKSKLESYQHLSLVNYVKNTKLILKHPKFINDNYAIIKKNKVIDGLINGKPARMPNESKKDFFYRYKNFYKKD